MSFESTLGAASAFFPGSQASSSASPALALAPEYVPICFVCQRESLRCDTYPSPLGSDSVMWCGSCLEDWMEMMEERAEERYL